MDSRKDTRIVLLAILAIAALSSKNAVGYHQRYEWPVGEQFSLCDAQRGEATSASCEPIEYRIVEKDRKTSTRNFELENVLRGETWLTYLELESPHVQIPLMREDSSQYSGYMGVIEGREVAVKWLVPRTLMLIEWRSTVPGGKAGYGFHLLVSIGPTRACVLQRVCSHWEHYRLNQIIGKDVSYDFVDMKSGGDARIERVVTNEIAGMDEANEHEGGEGVETRSVYIVMRNELEEVEYSNWAHVWWADVPASLDSIVDVAFARLPENNRAGTPDLPLDEQRRLLKEAILKKNPGIKDEKNCPHSVLLPYNGHLVEPLDPKDLEYPYSEITQTGWLDEIATEKSKAGKPGKTEQ